RARARPTCSLDMPPPLPPSPPCVLYSSVLPPDSSFFFSLVPRPPRSTLFPYTTLFRSAMSMTPVIATGAPKPASASRRPPASAQDRKSTRLNSSHVSISYAVFCLKKKTIDIAFDPSGRDAPPSSPQQDARGTTPGTHSI